MFFAQLILRIKFVRQNFNVLQRLQLSHTSVLYATSCTGRKTTESPNMNVNFYDLEFSSV